MEFMSDKQKGLIQAFREVFPDATHMLCVIHLLRNFYNASFRGEEYNDIIWKATTPTTVCEFKEAMNEMGELSQSALEWFDDKDPAHWSKAHFNTISTCDLIINNICESLNSSILDAREEGIITMWECIREYLLQRQTTNREKAERKWIDVRICPKIKEILDKDSEKIYGLIPMKCDEMSYQVMPLTDDSQHTIDLGKWKCSCMNRDLSGIPCKHAICALLHNAKRPINHISYWYTVEKYRLAYELPINGVLGPKIWGEIGYMPPLPPNFGRKAGRPHKSRRRTPDEEPITKKKRKTNKSKTFKAYNKGKAEKTQNLKRKQKTVQCSFCGISGDNIVTCFLRKAYDRNDEEDKMYANLEGESSMEEEQNGVHTQEPRVVDLNQDMEDIDVRTQSSVHDTRVNKKEKKKIMQTGLGFIASHLST